LSCFRRDVSLNDGMALNKRGYHSGPSPFCSITRNEQNFKTQYCIGKTVSAFGHLAFI